MVIIYAKRLGMYVCERINAPNWVGAEKEKYRKHVINIG
jgi:hypothetical protein